MDSAIFSVQETTSTSSDATVTAGITSRRSISLQKPDRSKDFRLLAASFDFIMWGVTDGGVYGISLSIEERTAQMSLLQLHHAHLHQIHNL